MAKNICRLCLNPSGCLISIHGKYNNEYNLMEIMYELTLMEILESDDLPNKVCVSCADKLVDFHDFRKMLLDSHVKLLSVNLRAKKIRNGDKKKKSNKKKRMKDDSPGKTGVSRDMAKDAFNGNAQPQFKKNLFICDKCQHIFKRRAHIETHLIGVHYPHLKAKVIKKKCPHCPRLFNDIDGRSNIPRHIKTVHKDIENAAIKSKDEWTAASDLLIEDTRQIKCIYCEDTFADTVEMYVHLKGHESDVKETDEGFDLYCDECQCDHQTLDLFAKHMTDKHGVADRKLIKPIKCRWCKERFLRIQGLYSHIRTAHKCFEDTIKTSKMINRAEDFNRSDSCLCTECGRVLSSPAALVAHLRTHTDIKPHLCHVCDTSFKHVGGLKQHMVTHTNERKYKCEVCDKGFNQVGHLTTHLMSHGIGIKKWHKCRMCEKQFYNRGNLKEHMLVHEVTRKIHKCGQCSIRFRRKYELDNHTLEEHVQIEFA